MDHTPTPTASSPLDISLKTGTFRGVLNATGIEKWLGIPYALAPVGSLRFKAPVPITRASNEVKNALAFGNACPQRPGNLGAPLFLNVFRPQGTTQNRGLPVLVWIHGGAFTDGAASEYDPTRIIQRSVTVNKPIIFVSINYRVNTFGFLSNAIVPPGDLNAGLHDQHQAFLFVKQNIAAFGGDPSKVTIWGQSAGAGSVEAHFLFPSSESLFRAGMADSSTGPFKTSPKASVYDEPGKPFARLLAGTGCPQGSGAVPCLQRVPFEVNSTYLSSPSGILNGFGNLPSAHFAPTESSSRVAHGDFLHLPYFTSTNSMRGTISSKSILGLQLAPTDENAAFDNFIGHLVIDNSTITTDVFNTMEQLFPPDDPLLGAPFNTRDSLFIRGASWYTDNLFLSPHRRFFEKMAPLQPTFVYYFREFIPGNDPTFGVAHESELTFLFGPIPAVAQVETTFANQMLDFYIDFINDLNPGPVWPAYNLQIKGVLQLLRDNITVIPDDFDLDQTNFLNSPRVLAEFQK